jgi:hypothetical protein
MRAVASARPWARRELGVDVVGALNLVGSLVKYLGLALLLPVAALMYLGRLEIVPVLVLFAGSYWRGGAYRARSTCEACWDSVKTMTRSPGRRTSVP